MTNKSQNIIEFIIYAVDDFKMPSSWSLFLKRTKSRYVREIEEEILFNGRVYKYTKQKPGNNKHLKFDEIRFSHSQF